MELLWGWIKEDEMCLYKTIQKRKMGFMGLRDPAVRVHFRYFKVDWLSKA